MLFHPVKSVPPPPPPSFLPPTLPRRPCEGPQLYSLSHGEEEYAEMRKKKIRWNEKGNDRVRRVEREVTPRSRGAFLDSATGCSLRMPFGSHLQCFKQTRLSSFSKIKEPVWKDVTLYYYNRQKFFRLVGLACASQFIFWGWMAYFLISLKRDKSQEKILDVSSSSNLGASWKIVRFVMVGINEQYSCVFFVSSEKWA